MKRFGFTLIELLVVISIIALLVGILVPSLQRVREIARQAVCAAHLHGLAKAVALYAAANDERMPALGDAAELGGPCTRVNTREQLFDQDDANLQAYWLLVDEETMPGDMVHCPSDDHWRAVDALGRASFGFGSWGNASFALMPATAHEGNALRRDGWQSAEVYLAGDRPPIRDGRVVTQEHTANHPGDGGNFLRGGGSAVFRDAEDNRFAAHGNNVYAVDLGSDGQRKAETTGDVLPTNPQDSFLHWAQPN